MATKGLLKIAAQLNGRPTMLNGCPMMASTGPLADPHGAPHPSWQQVISQTAQAFMPEYENAPDDADLGSWRRASAALAARLLSMAMIVAALSSLVGARGSYPLCRTGP